MTAWTTRGDGIAQPVIGSTYSTGDVQDALRHPEGGGPFGKIVVLPEGTDTAQPG